MNSPGAAHASYQVEGAWDADGKGRVNQAGLDVYSRVVDACLEAGVTQWITLYRWDLPQALHERGGWPDRSILGWFEEYVGVVTEALGDGVKDWMVFNEPCSFLFGGYLGGVHAPGVRSLRKMLAATHHVNLCRDSGYWFQEVLACETESGQL